METKWTKYDIVWIIFSNLLILIAGIYKFAFILDQNSNRIIEAMSGIAAMLGVTYVFGIAKKSRFAYFFGMAYVILYAIVCNSKGLYISSLYNILYSFPVIIYGYRSWGATKMEQEFDVKVLTTKSKVILAFGMLVGIILFAYISGDILAGSNAIADSVVTVTLGVATFLMAKKYIEQWPLFIIANAFGTIMFLQVNFYKLIDVELLIMWFIYLINSFYGMVEWKKELRRN